MSDDPTTREDEDQSASAQIAEMLLTLGDSMAPLFEAVDGYRRQAIDTGWGAEAASRIAADYHHYVIELLIHTMFGSAGRPPTEPTHEEHP